MKILLATDGSKDAVIAVETANRLLSSTGRDVDLLCVAPKLSQKKELQPRENRYERWALRQMTQILEQARTSIGPKCSNINVLTEFGSPSGLIVGRAEDYDLTVVGPKGSGTAGEVGLGPVASRVVEHALGPVLVARELRSEAGAIRVLAAVDGGSDDRRAANYRGALLSRLALSAVAVLRCQPKQVSDRQLEAEKLAWWSSDDVLPFLVMSVRLMVQTIWRALRHTWNYWARQRHEGSSPVV